MGKLKEFLTDRDGNIRDTMDTDFDTGYRAGQESVINELRYIEGKLDALIKDCQATRSWIGKNI